MKRIRDFWGTLSPDEKRKLKIILGAFLIFVIICSLYIYHQTAPERAINKACRQIVAKDFTGAMESADPYTYEKENARCIYNYAVLLRDWNEATVKCVLADQLPLNSKNYENLKIVRENHLKGSDFMQFTSEVEDLKKHIDIYMENYVSTYVQEEADELSHKIPYEGMKEIYLYKTAMGKASSFEKVMESGQEYNQYIWTGRDFRKFIMLEVRCQKGIVVNVKIMNEEMYWRHGTDVPPDPYATGYVYTLEDNSLWGTNKSSSSSSKYHISYSDDPYDVRGYNDADDFADEWAEEFGDGDADEGWDDAYMYYEDYKNSRGE